MADTANDETGKSGALADNVRRWLGVRAANGLLRARRALRDLQERGRFSTLTRRIVAFNVAALALLAGGILYVNQYQAGLIEERSANLRTQGEIIAGAIAEAATTELETQIIDPDSPVPELDLTLAAREAPIDADRAAPILRRLVLPTDARARLYSNDGVIVVDSRFLDERGGVIAYELPPPVTDEDDFAVWLDRQVAGLFQSGDIPRYEELPGNEGKGYAEVRAALRGDAATVVRANERGQLIVSVAVPVQRFKAVMGALMLTTEGGDIDALVRAERMAVLRVFGVLLVVTVLLAILLAGTIAAPVRRLAEAAERVRRQRNVRVEIPDFRGRRDEIGELSGALRDMTHELYARIDATERFAADVAHELKNPLTSLRSAVETFAIAKDDEARGRLQAIIRDDVSRLDRLISDISEASRVDAEMSRSETATINMADVLASFVESYDTAHGGGPRVVFDHEAGNDDEKKFLVECVELRIGQVLRNLVDNAVSFSPKDGTVRLTLGRELDQVVFNVEDEGPGIREENLETVFKRFYTDRPDPDAFGKNSGLGLSISRQIVEAHGGTIEAENRRDADGKVLGARFTVRLPAA